MIPSPRGRIYDGICPETCCASREPLTAWAGPYMSQTTENRKVETRKPLIFRDPIFGFSLQNPTLRQSRATCPDCGAPLKAKGYHSRTFRSLFGTFKLASPRLFHCRCRRRKTTSFRPLSALLTESAAPELHFMETKWSSLVSYGLTVEALTDFLPLA